MTEPAKFEPRLLHPEQESPQKTDDKPWLRQRNEPAKWFMSFKIYLEMGPQRSLRKALAIDKGMDIALSGDKRLREISLPGSWQRASKVWNWKKRAEAFDLQDRESKSHILQKIASGAVFCSRAYRILQLDTMATQLQQFLFQPNIEARTYLAVSARIQSIMKDISDEIAQLNINTAHADVVGLEDLIKSGRLKV